ncbi:MAG: cytochrome c3 family protein, partial [Chloroflexota bacterium]
AYTHNLHADQLAIQCLYCHRGASTGNIAQLPSEEVCMGCHRNVAGNTDDAKSKIKKLTDAYASQTPIVWNRVVDLPDHVGFSHRPHVRSGVQCTECHTREPSGVNWAKSEPGMAWCTTCHSTRGASTDCWTCHK